jgi:hypothetical protein
MITDVLEQALMITSFVLIMMLLIEYINVQTRGSWHRTQGKPLRCRGDRLAVTPCARVCDWPIRHPSRSERPHP